MNLEENIEQNSTETIIYMDGEQESPYKLHMGIERLIKMDREPHLLSLRMDRDPWPEFGILLRDKDPKIIYCMEEEGESPFKLYMETEKLSPQIRYCPNLA